MFDGAEGPGDGALAEARRGLEPVEAVSLALQASSGPETAHEAGLVHRDIKAQNLLPTPEGTLKIADFGIARSLDGTQLTEAGTVLGTAAYVAPEQAAAYPVTPAADIYALGAVLYELLTGRPPYVADTLQELFIMARLRPSASSRPTCPRRSRMRSCASLARDPMYRPESAEAFAGELGGPPTAVTRIERPAVSRRGPRWALVTTLVLGAALVLVLALALSLRGGSKQPEPAAPPPAAGSSAQQARGFATWLRDHAGG